MQSANSNLREKCEDSGSQYMNSTSTINNRYSTIINQQRPHFQTGGTTPKSVHELTSTINNRYSTIINQQRPDVAIQGSHFQTGSTSSATYSSSSSCGPKRDLYSIDWHSRIQ